MKNNYIFGKYILSGGWLALFYISIMFISEVTSFDPFQSSVSLYILFGVTGGLLLLHYIIFDIICTRYYVLIGIVCWLLAFAIFFAVSNHYIKIL